MLRGRAAAVARLRGSQPGRPARRPALPRQPDSPWARPRTRAPAAQPLPLRPPAARAAARPERQRRRRAQGLGDLQSFPRGLLRQPCGRLAFCCAALGQLALSSRGVSAMQRQRQRSLTALSGSKAGRPRPARRGEEAASAPPPPPHAPAARSAGPPPAQPAPALPRSLSTSPRRGRRWHGPGRGAWASSPSSTSARSSLLRARAQLSLERELLLAQLVLPRQATDEAAHDVVAASAGGRQRRQRQWQWQCQRRCQCLQRRQ